MQHFLEIGRTGRVFHLFCLFHLGDWNRWKSRNSLNSGDRLRRTLGILFPNKMISVPFELEWLEFGTLILVIPLPEKFQCSLKYAKFLHAKDKIDT